MALIQSQNQKTLKKSRNANTGEFGWLFFVVVFKSTNNRKN